MSQPTDARSAKAQAKADKAYRKASRPWYKKPFMLILFAIAAIVIIAIATSGGGDEPSPATGVGTGAGSEGAAGGGGDTPAFPGAQEGDQIAQAGEPIDLGGVVTTAAPLVQGEQFGQQYFCSTVNVQNNSDESASFNGAFDWKLQDPNGASRSTTLGGSDNLLNSGELAPGGTVSGDVCFDAPNAASGQYVVIFEPTFSFSSDRAAWINNR